MPHDRAGHDFRMSSRVVGLLRAVARPARGVARTTRRFGRAKEGAAAVEFAIIITPLLAIMFAIIEVALVFFAGQVLETATADSARRIMTGEVQKAGFNGTKFKEDLCGRVQALFDCEGGVHIDVQKSSSFPAGGPSMPINDEGELDTSNFKFEPGAQGDIVIVRVVYEWPTFVPSLGFDLANLANGRRLLMATAAFRNEPYTNPPPNPGG
jgi:Flp pilus assembly protein TadG